MDFTDLVVGVAREICVFNGVLDKEIEAAACVSLAVFAYKVVAFEYWDE